MQLTAKTEYACLAMVELARRQGEGKPVRLTDIVENHDIPQRFLVQILLQLKANGLVNTVRGAAGGYRLTKPADRITLAEIFEIAAPQETGAGTVHTESAALANLRRVMARIDADRLAVLQATTLASLIPEIEVMDYAI
jgi:Rrf2 family protein